MSKLFKVMKNPWITPFINIKKFKLDKVDDLDKAQCNVLRRNALDDLEVVKGQYKNGMLEEKKATEENKSSDGVATNQNKFFFDIIKWGSALLL